MALDGAFLHCILNELGGGDDCLIGARVDKIHQPSREEIVMTLRTRGRNVKLLLSANASSARIHLTEIALENPKQPPMFCMLLRKHLSSGRLINIRQDGLERIAALDFECMNELGDIVTITLICEIMGRHSNIIIVDSNGRIIDAIKRINAEMSSVRQVLSGMQYSPPPRQDKANFLTDDEKRILLAIDIVRNEELSKALIKSLEGISPIFARECAFYVTGGQNIFKDDLTDERKAKLLEFLGESAKRVKDGPHYTVVVEESGKLKDFSFVDIRQYGGMMNTVRYNTASELLDEFYHERDRQNRMRQRSHDLLKLVTNTAERISRRVEAQRIELQESRNREYLKICGDLINANIYRLERGQTFAEVENFYQEDSPIMKIKLDPRLSPAGNAQKYYSDYRKADNAEKKLKELIASGEQELIYIDSVLEAITRTTGESELIEIREELAQQGYLRRSRKTSKMDKPLPPIKYKSSDGYEILVGRNNMQNHKLSLKIAKKHDIWLHTQDIHGAHVIIITNGDDVPMSTLEEAAMIAAFHSKARESAGVPVDYTYARYVKKPNGAKPGMVIFDNNKTLSVTPDEKKVESLLIKH
ncbi:MAG: fibronectin/fibrinogen-binding protein [Clostridiales bacterium]|nr:fibronectin/fibrinogen-binding protein [Clostridiales bacterium]